MTLQRPTTTEIWVFGDLRNRSLLEMSFKVVSKAAELAQTTGDEIVLFLLAADRVQTLTRAEEQRCVLENFADEEAFAWGADVVACFEHEQFLHPTPHLFADALSPILREEHPRLVLFPLTGFGRDLAARCAAAARAGLIADCVALKTDNQGSIIGLCPAWGGEIIAEITYAPGQPTGYATVQPHGASRAGKPRQSGCVRHRVIDNLPKRKEIRLLSKQPAPADGNDLHSARTVVVGGAGLGSMENFGQVRELAAALVGQVAATRPPVLQHWVEENRLIGQTGTTVRPDLLISIGTSGAMQYTAGILDSGTIVAINRDPSAPIFQIADIGLVTDAATFLPLLIARIKQVVLRQLADEMCPDSPTTGRTNAFGEKIKSLRTARNWSQEQLAEATGQTPEFIATVESGNLSPPVAFLLRLSDAYGVDPGTFLRREEKERIRDQRTQAYVNRTRHYSYQTLTSGAENDHLRAFMVTIEPHHDHKPVAYKHEGEEFIFVMEGKLAFFLGSKVHTLKEGESIHFHSSTPHTLKSLTGEMTRCLVVLYTL